MAARAELDWERIARGSIHELQITILETLQDGERRSPSQLADELGEPLGNVSYHVRQLRLKRLLVPAGTRRRRGAVEHYYRAAR